jgi:hypothetical protein
MYISLTRPYANWKECFRHHCIRNLSWRGGVAYGYVAGPAYESLNALKCYLLCNIFSWRVWLWKWRKPILKIKHIHYPGFRRVDFINIRRGIKRILDFSAPRCFGTFYSNSSKLPLLRNKAYFSASHETVGNTTTKVRTSRYSANIPP